MQATDRMERRVEGARLPRLYTKRSEDEVPAESTYIRGSVRKEPNEDAIDLRFTGERVSRRDVVVNGVWQSTNSAHLAM